jgi:phosphoribosylamine---glycine ligase
VRTGQRRHQHQRLSSNDRPVESVQIDVQNLAGLADLAEQFSADLTVVGPDNPLGAGIVDLFDARGQRIWGPDRRAARLESSKAFAQEFMERYGIPAPSGASFTSRDPARRFAEELGGRCAVKADGLAMGKGVVVCRDVEEAIRAIDQILVHRAHGDAGARLVIQELLEGTEISLHALCDAETALLFPTSQDHKPIFYGDQGPNTGGMGAYSPSPFVDAAGLQELNRVIVQPFLEGCRAEQLRFRGVLYPGVMLTDRGPRVFELNARFGDPETQVYMPRLQTDVLELIDASVSGTLSRLDVRWNALYAVCVVLASAGYPGEYQTGHRIAGLDEVASLPHVKAFHAGTTLRDGHTVTDGGRIVGITAWAPDLATARRSAYRAAELVEFEGRYYRSDIGAKGLDGRRPH